ncbi:MAG: hypothetical protein ACI9YO_000951 [Gammaproteobacteria bacterium]
MSRLTNRKTSKEPLHGVTLKEVVTQLVDKFGWETLGQRIDIKCFNSDPSISSSLKFLRKTPWAREKVEQLYIDSF